MPSRKQKPCIIENRPEVVYRLVDLQAEGYTDFEILKKIKLEYKLDKLDQPLTDYVKDLQHNYMQKYALQDMQRTMSNLPHVLQKAIRHCMKTKDMPQLLEVVNTQIKLYQALAGLETKNIQPVPQDLAKFMQKLETLSLRELEELSQSNPEILTLEIEKWHELKNQAQAQKSS